MLMYVMFFNLSFYLLLFFHQGAGDGDYGKGKRLFSLTIYIFVCLFVYLKLVKYIGFNIRVIPLRTFLILLDLDRALLKIPS